MISEIEVRTGGTTTGMLTHICLVDLPILINWTVPFFGVSGVLFHLYLIFDRHHCMQTV